MTALAVRLSPAGSAKRSERSEPTSARTRRRPPTTRGRGETAQRPRAWGECVSSVSFAEFGRASIRELKAQKQGCRTAVSAYVCIRCVADITGKVLFLFREGW